MSVVLFCGLMAMVMAFASQSPPSLAMQETPTPPSDLARSFCPLEAPAEPLPALWAKDDPHDQSVTFAPITDDAGAVVVRDIMNPYPTPPALDSGTLVMTLVTLPAHTCIQGSYFYPSMVMTLTSGQISVLIEHWPGGADAPGATIVPGGNAFPDAFPIGTPTMMTAGDWVTIENESFVGFRNETDVDATFSVAGIKPAGDPGGGGGHRGRP
jgi:hypothetical protein